MTLAPIENRPEHATLAKDLVGTALDAQKTTILRVFSYFAREGKYFAGSITARIQTVRYDVETNAGGRESAELEVALRVEDDMINGFGTLHGGCSAYLVDITTSICLTGLMVGHVTLSLDIICHAAAPKGAMLRIIARTTSVGKRVLSTRCEISDKDSGRLYVTGTHIKMPVSHGPKL